MRKVALAIAATLVLGIISPAFSQPFADVPTDHWAFDAIAELAAKGIVEGYPDGTFKGDRAMTRYEMAMVVARLLARVEAIKIPPATPPTKIPPAEVGRADIQTLQRLVNEFRAELAALGVRVTAVEEELAALRARVDNTRVTGFTFFRYQASNLAPGGNYTFGLFNLTFTGQASSTASVTVNLLLDSGDGGIFAFETPIAGNATPCTSCLTTYPTPGASFDRAYLDARAFGLAWRLGRQTYTLGPIGLLFREGSVNINGGNSQGADGLKLSGSFGPLGFEVAGFTHIADPGINQMVGLLMARATFGLMPGWTIGANFYTERRNHIDPLVDNTAMAPNTSNTGWSFDLSGGLIPGVTLQAEYATFTPSGAAAATAIQVNATVNLGQLTGMMTFAPSLRLQYKDYGTGWTPEFRGGNDLFAIGNTNDYNAWNARLQLTFTPQFRPYVNYESGRIKSTGVTQTELEVGFFSLVTTAVTAQFRYQLRTTGGTQLTNRYRLQLDTSW